MGLRGTFGFRIVALLLIFFLSLPPCFGQSAGTAPATSGSQSTTQTKQTQTAAQGKEEFPPRDTKTQAVLGVAEFHVLRSQAQGEFLGRSVAGLFLERLSEIKTHTVDPTERKAAALGIIGSSRRKLLKEIDDYYAKRDLILFSGLAQARSDKVVEYSSAMEAGREKLRKLNFLSWEDVEIVREKKLALAKANVEGKFLDPVKGDPALAAAAAQADYLVYGTVEEELAGYYSVTVNLYGVLAEKVLYSGYASGELDEMDRVVDELFLEFATAVSGRDWAVLDVAAEPKDAGIFINGNLAGIGKARLAYTSPGIYRVEVKAAGYEGAVEEAVLIPFAREKKTFSLVPLDARKIILNSIPPGASFYRGALREGNLPLEIAESGKPEISRLELEGHKGEIFVFPSDNDRRIHLLPRDIFTWEERIEKKREDFYSALGWFVLSVPFPVLFYGLFESEAFGYLQYTRGSYDRSTARGMAEKKDILYYSFLGSLFLSGSFLLDAVIKLIDYINVGEAAQKYPDRKRKD